MHARPPPGPRSHGCSWCLPGQTPVHSALCLAAPACYGGSSVARPERAAHLQVLWRAPGAALSQQGRRKRGRLWQQAVWQLQRHPAAAPAADQVCGLWDLPLGAQIFRPRQATRRQARHRPGNCFAANRRGFAAVQGLGSAGLCAAAPTSQCSSQGAAPATGQADCRCQPTGRPGPACLRAEPERRVRRHCRHV